MKKNFVKILVVMLMLVALAAGMVIPASAELCNLMEQPIEKANIAGSAITFDMKPYEIKSFLIK